MELRINPNIVVRNIGRECVLVPVGQNLDDVRCIYNLNETAGFIIRGIQQKAEVADIVRAFEEEFEASTGEIQQAVEETIQQLRDHGIVL